MAIALTGPGRALLRAPGRAGLWQPLRAGAGGVGGGFAGPYPNAVTGLSGWWDAGVLADVLAASGAPVVGWGSAVASLRDKSGNARPMTLLAAGTGGAVVTMTATARVNGYFGGLGRVAAAQGVNDQPGPALDASLGLQVPSVPMGANAAWSRYLVWTRPNWRQNTGSAATDAAPVTLLASGGVPVVQADSAGGSGRLSVFGTVVAATLARRHTHSLLLVNTPGAGCAVWLDGTQVSAGVTVPGTFGTATLSVLTDGTATGAAQCWFHEAAFWERALTVTDVTTLLAAAARWTRGARKCATLLFTGQSNAAHYVLDDGAAVLLAQGVAWHLGAAAYNVFGSASSGSGTLISGHGLYAAGAFSGDFLRDPGDGSSPDGWALGADGQSVQAFVTARQAADLADVCAIVWPWTETDSTRSYGAAGTVAAAARRFLALERGMIGATAASVPMVWWNAIPSSIGTTGGIQMMREVAAQLAADPAQTVVIGNPMTANALPRGATANADGTWSGGDSVHTDAPDNIRYARQAAPVVARAVLAARGGDTIGAIPVGVPTLGGPRITRVYRQSSTVLVITVAHDVGSDLKVPLQAAKGIGFAVMDGGSVAAPGVMRPAVSCVKISATQLAVTLASALTNPSAQCGLFYPYGTTLIGRGNAVTDNASARTPPDGWDIGGDLGSAWRMDCPLAATATPAVLSDTPQ